MIESRRIRKRDRGFGAVERRGRRTVNLEDSLQVRGESDSGRNTFKESKAMAGEVEDDRRFTNHEWGTTAEGFRDLDEGVMRGAED